MKTNNYFFLKIIPVVIFALYWFFIYTLEMYSLGLDQVNVIQVNALSFIKKVFTFHGFIVGVNLLYIFVSPILVFIFLHFYIKDKYLKRILILLAIIFFSFFYHFYIFILLYKNINYFGFDFYFFWYNRSIALITMLRMFFWITILFPVSFILFGGILYLFKYPLKFIKTKKRFVRFLIVLFLISIASQAIHFSTARAEMVDFIYKHSKPNNIARLYYANYKKNLDLEIKKNFQFTEKVNSATLGNNIFVLELESLNSFLISEDVTPHLLDASKEGIFFPQFYATSVQSIRALESFLCGLPPSLRLTLVDELSSEQLSSLPCLPRIMRQLGYRTIYFKSDRLDNAHTDEFVRDIGFDEMHYNDIMKVDDPKLAWGYREDIFYKRIFEYLEKYDSDEKLFVYIAISSTNHAPFNDLDSRYLDAIPFPEQNSHISRIKNTSYIQDAYIENFMTGYKNMYSHNSTLILTSDHSWPIAMHQNNYLSYAGAFEENFLIPFLFIPPDQGNDIFYTNMVVSRRYSQTDVLPTLIHIIDPENDYQFLGESFAHEIVRIDIGQVKEVESKILAQPNSGGFIDVVRYPDKYMFDMANNMVIYYNLIDDPDESHPTIYRDPQEYYYLINQYFQK